jgi:hypothetical protein
MPGGGLSVIVVSDFEEGAQRSWLNERGILEGLARQDIHEPFEVVLVENERHRDTIPSDLLTICPGLRIVYSPATRSAELKDFGVSQVDSELVGVLEADCIPNPPWLRVLVDVFRRHPEVSAVSGRTTYGDESMYRRSLSLLDRAFDDLGPAGVAGGVSNNGALYRRSLLVQFPYPPTISPFTSARIRNQAIRQAGHVLFFEPAAVMRHAVGGWRFLRDFRRQTGYSDMFCYAARRLRSLPRVLWLRRTAQVRDCRRLGADYLRWYDWPLMAALLVTAPILELPGMFDALRERDRVPNTSYH